MSHPWKIGLIVIVSARENDLHVDWHDCITGRFQNFDWTENETKVIKAASLCDHRPC